MNLLIITQKVDKNDSVLGFFHRWIEEFAKQCDRVVVVCLFEGVHTLPENVRVLSLGKEEGVGRFEYLRRFYVYLWRERENYDAVFVHMNQIYVILGGVLWRMMGKKVGLWYAHGAVPWLLRVATLFSHHIFTSTEQGFRLATKKKCVVGQGIDAKQFFSVERARHDFLHMVTVGRISSAKNLDVLLRACARAKEHGVSFLFSIFGAPLTEEDKKIEREVKWLVSSLALEKEVLFKGVISQDTLPRVLQEADIFLSAGGTGSLDKALLEAVLCGCVVVSSNSAYATVMAEKTPHYFFPAGDAEALACVLKKVAVMNIKDREESMRPARAWCQENTNLERLVGRVLNFFKNSSKKLF
jgi:glycosyltransferase involved in cell wall biosynthesis